MIPIDFQGHMFKGQGQTTLEPTVLPTIYILIPCLLALDRFCFYREDKPEFCTMGGIYVSETFLVFQIYVKVLLSILMKLIHITKKKYVLKKKSKKSQIFNKYIIYKLNRGLIKFALSVFTLF